MAIGPSCSQDSQLPFGLGCCLLYDGPTHKAHTDQSLCYHHHFSVVSDASERLAPYAAEEVWVGLLVSSRQDIGTEFVLHRLESKHD